MCDILREPNHDRRTPDMDTSGLIEKKMKKGKNGRRGSRFFTPDGALVARTCATCDKVKPLGDFPPATNTKDGVASNCKACTKNFQESYRKSSENRYTARPPEEVAIIRKETYPDSLKVCKSCSATKDLSEFYQNPSYRSGVSSKCKMCTTQESSDRQKKHAQEDPDYYKKTYQRRKRA